MTQLAFPVEVSTREITREKTLGDAILLCIKASGMEAKELRLPFNLDKAQLSRWQSGDEGIKWPKLQALMDTCGKAFTGIERERKYFDIAVERISRAQAQGQLLPPEPARECVQDGLL